MINDNKGTTLDCVYQMDRNVLIETRQTNTTLLEPEIVFHK